LFIANKYQVRWRIRDDIGGEKVQCVWLIDTAEML